MFVGSYILNGKEFTCQLFVAGFFYVCTITICGLVPPCKSIMGLLPLRCKTTGQAEPFFSAYNQNLSVMSYTEKEVCTCQACGKPKEQSLNETLNDFFEMYNAKQVKEIQWSGFLAAIGSREMDSWSALDRASLAFLYEKLTGLIAKLEVIHLKKTLAI